MKNSIVCKCLVFIFMLHNFFSAEAVNLDSLKLEIFAPYTTEEIKIDGLATEKSWKQNTSIASDFYQNFPYDTSYAITQTEVKVLQDEENIYVFAICYDSTDADYVVQSLKRDWSYPRSDAFVVSFEPFNDYTNGFSFGVNPYGAQREGLIENGGNFGVSTAWDNKWFAKTTRQKGFWTAEFQIPLKSLRYKTNLQKWRINFARNNLKINENSTWHPVPRILNIAVLSHMGKVKWEKPIHNGGLNAAIIPYSTVAASKNYQNNSATDYTPNVGFDAKVVLTSSLNLDLTVNPDFSQVDVDVQQVNLTRFNLFFPERRQFFIENSDLFANFGFRQIRPFFSRRIGLRNGQIVPITAGARLSGKLGTKWRIGAMNIQTAEHNPTQTAAANYSVAAFQRNIFSSSNIAGIVVNKWVQDMDSIEGFTNTVVGLDYNLISKDNKWRGKVFYHQSLTNGKYKEEAAAHASWFMFNTINWFAMWNHEFVGKDYNAQVGFTPRIFIRDDASNITYRQSYWRLEPEIKRRFYPKSDLINRYEIGVYNSTYFDSSFQMNDMLLSPFGNINFQNSAIIAGSFRMRNVLLYYPIDITGNSGNLAARRYQFNEGRLTFISDRRQPFFYSVGSTFGGFYSGNKITVEAEANLRVQPKAIFSLSYRRDDIQLPSPNLNTTLSLIGPKIEYNFTKKWFSTLFVQYNTQSENMNINARIQYRFAPMSDLFIVFSENYLPNTVNFLGNEDFPYLSIKNRALTIKLSYWLNT